MIDCELGAKLNHSRDRRLDAAALHHDGCWREALRAAGINLANVTHRRPKHFDRETILLWLCNRRVANQSLIYIEIGLENSAHSPASHPPRVPKLCEDDRGDQPRALMTCVCCCKTGRF